MTEFDWVEPYLRAGVPVDGAGNYNRNYIVPRGGETVVARVPIAGAEALDFRVIPETAVLPVLAAEGFPAPRLLHTDPQRRFALHSYIPGRRLDALFSVRAPLPDWTALDLGRQLAWLHRLDPASLEPYCAAIPPSPDSAALLETLIAFTERAATPLRGRHPELYARLRVPAEPLAPVRALAKELPPARFTICHCDVHRRNLIVAPATEALTIIDWELALVADPALDLAIHLHRMRYQPRQEELFLETYRRWCGEPQDAGLLARIDVYRRHEQVRSALIDLARTVADLREDLPPETRWRLVEHYRLKLVRAWEIWGVSPDPELRDDRGLMEALEEAGRRATSER